MERAWRRWADRSARSGNWRRSHGADTLIELASGRAAFAKEYSGSLANPRLYSHTASDEIHEQQRRLRGVARTKLRSRRPQRRTDDGPVGARTISNIYIADYDGANDKRVTATRGLDITPVWSPDTKAIAYTSYRTGFQDVLVSYIYEGRLTNPTAGTSEKQNFLPAWSPDGSKLAFTQQPGRQQRDLRRQPRRIRYAPADQPPDDRRDADLVTDRQPDRLYVRIAPARRRSGL
jgi:Tol biopolymer transport system component